MSGVYIVPRRLTGRRPWAQKLAQGVESNGLAALAFYLRRLPLDRAQAAARRMFVRLGPRTNAHRDLVANLAVLHPSATTDQLQSRAQRTWGWLGVTIAEIVHVRELSQSVGQQVELNISPAVDEMLRKPGQATVFASAHVGPWLLCNLVAARYGFPLTATIPSSANDAIDRTMRSLLRALPVEQVAMDDAYASLAAELEKGHKVSIAVDGWNDQGHTVRVLGERMRLDPTAALLAVRNNCPLVPIHTLRIPGGKYRVIAASVLLPDATIESETERAKKLTEAFATQLERWIRGVPGQWLCLTPRWADETVWGALTRVTELTQQQSEHTVRMTEEQLDAVLAGETSVEGDVHGVAGKSADAGGDSGRPPDHSI